MRDAEFRHATGSMRVDAARKIKLAHIRVATHRLTAKVLRELGHNVSAQIMETKAHELQIVATCMIKNYKPLWR